MRKICIQILIVIIAVNYTQAEPKVTVTELISGWTLRNQNGTIEISGLKLPSGVYSALSSEFGDILHSDNDEKLRWIAYDNWTYIAEFDVLDYTFTQRINLTLHGIDTVATIRLNGREIGRTENMFVRYSFNINEAVREQNILEIEIQSPILAAKKLAGKLSDNYPPKCPPGHIDGVCHRNMLRKMQSSFGSESSPAALSMGIWKYVTLEFYDTAIMRDVDVAVFKNESHWNMDIRVFLSSGLKKNFYGNLTFMAPDLLDEPVVFETRNISYTSLQLDYRVQIPKEKVIEWWPNGYGEQKLYPIIFIMKCFEEKNSNFRSGWITQKVLNFGFRTIQLVENEDRFGRTFYFKVNGKPIFIKGAIYLPSHILPEEESHLSSSGQSRSELNFTISPILNRNSREKTLTFSNAYTWEIFARRVKHLMKSAKEANFNMIRIWGGGVYGSDLLYSYADIFGLLIWQDLPFTTSTYPLIPFFVENVRHEVAQNAKRIGYHPSLALIVTNNEIELYLVKNYTDFESDRERLEKEYIQFFMGIVRHELKVISRDEYNPQPGPMLTTPSLGFALDEILPVDPQNPKCGDVHYWPASDDDALDSHVWPMARFISEYGFQSLPIRSSWNRTCGNSDTISNLMQHRQQAVQGFNALKQVIENNLPSTDLDVDEFIYLSQIAQALVVKTATEVFLSNHASYRTMGAIFWHLNDVWIAPTWSSIDFYGNYKILYYWSRLFLAPTTIIPIKDKENNALTITIINQTSTESEASSEEDENSLIFKVTISVYLWSEFYAQKSITREEYMGTKDIKKFSVDLGSIISDSFNENNCFLEIALTNGDRLYASNFFFPGKIKDAIGIKDPGLSITELRHANGVISSNSLYFFSYSITIRARSPAFFVYIEIFHPKIKKYVLSNNGFLLLEPITVIHLNFEHESKELETELTDEHIKVTTMNEYILGRSVSAEGTTASESLTESNSTSSVEVENNK